MGWKPEGLCWLLRALGLLGGDAGGDDLGAGRASRGLLHGLDKDALAGGQQAEYV
jgi:hypothetical protein